MLVKTEPIRAVLVPIALAAFAAAAQAFLAGASTRGIITAALGVLVVAAQEYARSKVTPTARLRARSRVGQAGYGLVEMLIAAVLLVLLVILVLRLA
jgi:hypothetical protein